MGIDIIKNLTYSKKKRKIKFDLADNNITPLTFWRTGIQYSLLHHFSAVSYNGPFWKCNQDKLCIL